MQFIPNCMCFFKNCTLTYCASTKMNEEEERATLENCMDSSILELLLNETEDVIHTSNRESHAFLCNFGDKLHSVRAKITLATLVQLLSPTPHTIIPKLHLKACDFKCSRILRLTSGATAHCLLLCLLTNNLHWEQTKTVTPPPL